MLEQSAMLGDILGGLTNPAAAEGLLDVVAEASVRERIRAAAAAEGVAIGELVVARVRRLLDYGSEDIWLDLLGVMANAPQPAAAAVERMLARVFPEPVRVRISRPAYAHH
jgi:hypothetical protein